MGKVTMRVSGVALTLDSWTKGGWAVTLRQGERGKKIGGHEKLDVTEERMTLCGLINGLGALTTTAAHEVVVYCESGTLKWELEHGPTRNPDLWKVLNELRGKHRVTFRFDEGDLGDEHYFAYKQAEKCLAEFAQDEDQRCLVCGEKGIHECLEKES